MKHILKLALIPLLVMSLITGVVHAITQNMTATLRFLDPLTITAVTNPDLGDWLSTAVATLTYNMDTTGAVTGTASANYIAGSNTVGTITIGGSTLGTIDIVANNFAVVGGMVVTSVPCAYDGAAEATCSGAGLVAQTAPGAGRILLIGINSLSSTAHADATTSVPTFDIVVTYN